MLKLTYQGMWSATTNVLSGANFNSTAVKEQVPAVFAEVSTWRVILWVALNLLLTLASILLWMVQAGCARATVEDTVLTGKLLGIIQSLIIDAKCSQEDGRSSSSDGIYRY
jgi:hypothetical protein